MLTYEECLDMCDINQDEVSAIAEHEHVDPIIALAMGQYLCCHNGESKIQSIILDDKTCRKGRQYRTCGCIEKSTVTFYCNPPCYV